MQIPSLSPLQESQNEAKDKGFRLSGDLTFSTVAAIYEQNHNFGAYDGSQITIILSEVNRVDSSALALLIEWLRIAKQHGKTLCFKSVPQQLLDLAKLSALQEIFQQQEC